MRKPVQSNTRGVLARVWNEAVFARNAANEAGHGRSSLNSLGSSILRSRRPNPTNGWNSAPTSSSSAFIDHFEYVCQGVGSREKEGKREKEVCMYVFYLVESI